VSCQCVAHVAHGPRQHATGCIQAWNVLAHREAFAAWLPFWGVPFSYGVAISYVLVDTADKGIKAYQLARSELDANASLHPEVDTPRYTCLAPRPQFLDSTAQVRYVMTLQVMCKVHNFIWLLEGIFCTQAPRA